MSKTVRRPSPSPSPAHLGPPRGQSTAVQARRGQNISLVPEGWRTPSRSCPILPDICRYIYIYIYTSLSAHDHPPLDPRLGPSRAPARPPPVSPAAGRPHEACVAGGRPRDSPSTGQPRGCPKLTPPTGQFRVCPKTAQDQGEGATLRAVPVKAPRSTGEPGFRTPARPSSPPAPGAPSTPALPSAPATGQRPRPLGHRPSGLPDRHRRPTAAPAGGLPPRGPRAPASAEREPQDAAAVGPSAWPGAPHLLVPLPARPLRCA